MQFYATTVFQGLEIRNPPHCGVSFLRLYPLLGRQRERMKVGYGRFGTGAIRCFSGSARRVKFRVARGRSWKACREPMSRTIGKKKKPTGASRFSICRLRLPNLAGHSAEALSKRVG